MGVRRVIVAVNKMDYTHQNKYSEQRFIQIKEELTPYLLKVGYKFD